MSGDAAGAVPFSAGTSAQRAVDVLPRRPGLSSNHSGLPAMTLRWRRQWPPAGYVSCIRPPAERSGRASAARPAQPDPVGERFWASFRETCRRSRLGNIIITTWVDSLGLSLSASSSPGTRCPVRPSRRFCPIFWGRGSRVLSDFLLGCLMPGKRLRAASWSGLFGAVLVAGLLTGGTAAHASTTWIVDNTNI